MNKNILSGFILILLFCSECAQAQTKKFDTTVKMGDQGYRVESSNKNATQNDISVSAIGLKIDNRIPSFPVPGIVTKVMTDDLNDDSYPDLVICVYSGTNAEIGTVVGIAYSTDKTLAPVYFPDIFLDAKLREGYKGYDEFSTLTGTLMRKFPIYLPGDETGKPKGGTRTVQYKAMMDNGHLSFKVLRTFDVK